MVLVSLHAHGLKGRVKILLEIWDEKQKMASFMTHLPAEGTYDVGAIQQAGGNSAKVLPFFPSYDMISLWAGI